MDAVRPRADVGEPARSVLAASYSWRFQRIDNHERKHLRLSELRAALAANDCQRHGICQYVFTLTAARFSAKDP